MVFCGTYTKRVDCSAPGSEKSGFRFEKSDADLETLVYISIYAAPENVNFINTMIDKIL